ncbi:AAA family ATPase [Embleya sp. NPDC056575]|uniref:AAA family ATPase n=1 Tax=unclassified Embleya TaxID=2699296 RepID=UPI0036A67487
MFTGRREELDRLLAAADRTLGGAGVVQVRAVDGMPGVGKTALVAHAAALLADRYPDGRHVIELHAHALDRGPADPAEALAALLRRTGVDSRFVPDTLEERAAMWRDQLAAPRGDPPAKRRVLLVLDDAADAAQVEPFLPGPGTDGCLVLVTSRRRLPGLHATDTIDLGVMPPDDAALLFTRILRRPPAADPARRAADQAAVEEIVSLCGHLPLAIDLLAGRIAAHPGWGLPAYAREFAETRDRLAELTDGDRAVAAAFEMSYRGLTPALRRMFRRLALHPGSEIDRYAAALAGVPLARARRELEALYTARLITEPARIPDTPAGTAIGRYRLHDLLRAYAHTLVTRPEPATRPSPASSTTTGTPPESPTGASGSPRTLPTRPGPPCPTATRPWPGCAPNAAI